MLQGYSTSNDGNLKISSFEGYLIDTLISLVQNSGDECNEYFRFLFLCKYLISPTVDSLFYTSTYFCDLTVLHQMATI